MLRTTHRDVTIPTIGSIRCPDAAGAWRLESVNAMTLQTNAIGESEPLFGRGREVLTVQAAIDSAVNGRGQLVLVSGEAGIGKTSLIEHAIATHPARIRALIAACRELMTSPPYEIWIDLLDGFRRTTAENANLIPSSFASGAGPDQAVTRSELFADLNEFLTNLAAAVPVVIVLEDLHWSDDASLDLLHHIAIGIERLPVVVIASYRDVEVTSGIPLYRWLPRLVRDARATRVDLRQLDLQAVEQLIAARYPMRSAGDERQLAGWLYRHGEGIPFFTIELLYNLEVDGQLERSGATWTVHDLGSMHVPLLVRQHVDQRLERLDLDQIRILQMAAVIGNEVPLDLWAAVTGVDDLQLIGVIETAERIGVFNELVAGDGYRFSHALFRATLYNQIILPRRRNWHVRVAEAVAGSAGADPDVVAHHFQMAGDSRAGRWLVDAGRRAVQRFAYQTASERFEQALDMFDDDLPAEDRGWLLCDLALTFRFADANRGFAYVDRAIQLAAETDNQALGLYSQWCRAQIRNLRGDNALDNIDELVASVDSVESNAAERQVSRAMLAQVYARYGAYDRAVMNGQMYLEQRPGEVSAAAAHANSAIALAAAGRGDIATARGAFSRARAIAAQLGDPHLTGMLLNWEIMDIVLPYFADQKEARQQLAADAIDAWDRVQMPGSNPDDSRPSTDMSVFATLLLDGAWDTAEEQARIDLEFDGMRFDALRVLCILAFRRGDLSTARSHLQRALPQGPATKPSNYYFFSALWLMRTAAEIAIVDGDLDLAERWLNTHNEWMRWSGRLLNRSEGLIVRARILQKRGDLRGAIDSAGQAREFALEPRQPLAMIEADLMLGQLALDSGDREAAERYLDSTLSLANACSAPWEIARVQVERAVLYRRTGQGDGSAEAMAQARDIAERLQAAPLLERLDAIALEEADQSAPDVIPGGLSPRELEVLQLVARGMTDAEVGDALFISPRTVGRHLRSVYNKLDVNSRTAASAFAFQHGLVADS